MSYAGGAYCLMVIILCLLTSTVYACPQLPKEFGLGYGDTQAEGRLITKPQNAGDGSTYFIEHDVIWGGVKGDLVIYYTADASTTSKKWTRVQFKAYSDSTNHEATLTLLNDNFAHEELLPVYLLYNDTIVDAIHSLFRWNKTSAQRTDILSFYDAIALGPNINNKVRLEANKYITVMIPKCYVRNFENPTIGRFDDNLYKATNFKELLLNFLDNKTVTIMTIEKGNITVDYIDANIYYKSLPSSFDEGENVSTRIIECRANNGERARISNGSVTISFSDGYKWRLIISPLNNIASIDPTYVFNRYEEQINLTYSIERPDETHYVLSSRLVDQSDVYSGTFRLLSRTTGVYIKTAKLHNNNTTPGVISSVIEYGVCSYKGIQTDHVKATMF